jgi:glutamine---fructose-6-phosphate transaminase (isomerizing)
VTRKEEYRNFGGCLFGNGCRQTGSQINNIARKSEFERIIINMCGIVGYIGKNAAVDVLIAGLSKLEYRGYDSVGISLFQNSKIVTQKSKGRIDDMVKKIDLNQFKSANTGIGHTRWATHGEPSDINSHPHGTPRITLVHNGIIENYMQVKERMIRKGYTFESETDTEALAKVSGLLLCPEAESDTGN